MIEYDFDFKTNHMIYKNNPRFIAKHLDWNRIIWEVDNTTNAISKGEKKFELKDNFGSTYARHFTISLLAQLGYTKDKIKDISKHSTDEIEAFLKIFGSKTEKMHSAVFDEFKKLSI